MAFSFNSILIVLLINFRMNETISFNDKFSHYYLNHRQGCVFKRKYLLNKRQYHQKMRI
jgi:hypothetical protein